MSASGGARWIVNPTPDGVLLVHGRPGSDDVDHSFLCRAGRMHLRYALADADEPYGTVRQTEVMLTTDRGRRALPATATFDEGGSPSVDAIVDDPAGAIRDLMASGTMATADPWGEYALRAPPSAALTRFAGRCGIALR